jgi:hypothetical protein
MVVYFAIISADGTPLLISLSKASIRSHY